MTHMRPVVQGLLWGVDLPDYLDNADDPEDDLEQEEDEFWVQSGKRCRCLRKKFLNG